MELEFLNNTLKDIDVDLISFYHDVIGSHPDPDATSQTKKALKKLQKRYSKKLKRNDPVSISFETSAVRNAYLFYYCPCFTGAVAFNFVRLLRGIPKNDVQELFSKDNLTVCCLGGGPGTEIVAISHVMKDVLSNCSSERNGVPLVINAIVVDIEAGWAETAKEVVLKLQELVGESVMKLNFSFLLHDLTNPVTDELREVLGRSDIVTMSKFFSAIHGPTTADDRSRIMKDICELMPYKGILFSLDSSGWKFFDDITVAISSFVNMTPILIHLKTKCYWMSKASRKACLQLYCKRYGSRLCTIKTFNKVGAWRKTAIENGDDYTLLLRTLEIV